MGPRWQVISNDIKLLIRLNTSLKSIFKEHSLEDFKYLSDFKVFCQNSNSHGVMYITDILLFYSMGIAGSAAGSGSGGTSLTSSSASSSSSEMSSSSSS